VLSAIEDLTTDLEDLRLAVSECERDPYRFGLEIQQVAQRRRWLTEIEGEIGDMQEELDKESLHVGNSSFSPVNGSSSDSNYNNNNKRQSYNPDNHINGNSNNDRDYDNSKNNNDNDDPYTAHEQLHQQQLMRNQDEQLDSVYRTVRNLGIQAGDMGRELEEQNEIIQETDAIADRVDSKLKKGVKGLDRFIRKNEGILRPPPKKKNNQRKTLFRYSEWIVPPFACVEC